MKKIKFLDSCPGDVKNGVFFCCWIEKHKGKTIIMYLGFFFNVKNKNPSCETYEEDAGLTTR